MENAKKRLGEAMYRTGIGRKELIMKIAEANGVALRTAQHWFREGGPIEEGRIFAALDDIEKEYGKEREEV